MIWIDMSNAKLMGSFRETVRQIITPWTDFLLMLWNVLILVLERFHRRFFFNLLIRYIVTANGRRFLL